VWNAIICGSLQFIFTSAIWVTSSNHVLCFSHKNTVQFKHVQEWHKMQPLHKKHQMSILHETYQLKKVNVLALLLGAETIRGNAKQNLTFLTYLITASPFHCCAGKHIPLSIVQYCQPCPHNPSCCFLFQSMNSKHDLANAYTRRHVTFAAHFCAIH